VGKVIVGHDAIVDGTLMALLAGGHVLLEGVPGLGKTLLVRTLSDVLDISFNRIQFTPDLMPADILGTNIVMETPGGRREFVFQTDRRLPERDRTDRGPHPDHRRQQSASQPRHHQGAVARTADAGSASPGRVARQGLRGAVGARHSSEERNSGADFQSVSALW